MRTAFVLTTNENSERSQFSKHILENVGFIVRFFNCVPHSNKVLSNKHSMLQIYETISNEDAEWAYVFEDDINILMPIGISEIIEYEQLTPTFFYLGICLPYYFTEQNRIDYSKEINGTKVYGIRGAVRGLHAIGISKTGARLLLDFSKNFESFEYMDMILEEFSQINPAPVVRMDLESYISGHQGIFFQDRNRFPSSI